MDIEQRTLNPPLMQPNQWPSLEYAENRRLNINDLQERCQGMDELKHHEKMALEYLKNVGKDQVGVIDDENKLAAALTYNELKNRGYIIADIQSEGGPVYRLSKKGKEFLSISHAHI